MADAEARERALRVERLRVDPFYREAVADALAASEARVAALEAAEGALRFYANPATYEESSEPDPERFASGVIPIRDDYGARARAVLSARSTEEAAG